MQSIVSLLESSEIDRGKSTEMAIDLKANRQGPVLGLDSHLEAPKRSSKQRSWSTRKLGDGDDGVLVWVQAQCPKLQADIGAKDLEQNCARFGLGIDVDRKTVDPISQAFRCRRQGAGGSSRTRVRCCHVRRWAVSIHLRLQLPCKILLSWLRPRPEGELGPSGQSFSSTNEPIGDPRRTGPRTRVL